MSSKISTGYESPELSPEPSKNTTRSEMESSGYLFINIKLNKGYESPELSPEPSYVDNTRSFMNSGYVTEGSPEPRSSLKRSTTPELSLEPSYLSNRHMSIRSCELPRRRSKFMPSLEDLDDSEYETEPRRMSKSMPSLESRYSGDSSSSFECRSDENSSEDVRMIGSMDSDVQTRGEAVKEALRFRELQLRVERSRIIKTKKSSRKYVEYCLDVETSDHQWSIWYRYSDWVAFDEDLVREKGCDFFSKRQKRLGVFPKKRVIKTSKSVRKERMAMFHEYINGLKKDWEISGNGLFRQFICGNTRIIASNVVRKY